MRRTIKKLHGKKFVRDAAVLQVASFVQAGSYLLTSVLTKYFLGMHEMGRWTAARNIFSVAYFLVTMGVVGATVSRYSEGVGRGDRGACINALAAMLKIGLVSFVIVTAAAFLFAPAISEHYYADHEVGHFASLLCIAGLFEVVRGLTVVALQGTRQMRSFAWFDITSSMIRMVLVFGALAGGFGVRGVVWAFLLHMALAGAISLHFYGRARRGDPKLAPPPLGEVFAAVPGANVRSIFGLSYLMALNKGMGTLVPLFGAVLIPGLADVKLSGEAFKANAAYQIAYVLSWGLGMAMTGVVQALLPALGLKLGRTDAPFEQMGGLLKRVSLTAGSLMVGATVLSVPVMYFEIKVFYGAGAEDSFKYYLWLTAGNLFIGFTVVTDVFYLYSGRLKLAVRINLLLAAVALGGIVLGGKLGGPIGVAAAVALTDGLGLFHLVYIWLFFRRAKARALQPGPSP